LQRVLEMYQDRGFTVLAITVEPAQRDLVAPGMTAPEESRTVPEI